MNISRSCVFISAEKSRDYVVQLISMLQANAPEINKLVIRFDIGTDTIVEIIKSIDNNTNLQNITFVGNFTEYTCFDTIAGISNLLSNNTTLSTLVIKKSKIDISMANELVKILGQAGGLRHLNLSYNMLDCRVVVSIAQTLVSNNCLETLGLRNSFVCYAGSIALAESLCKNNCLRELDLSHNMIRTESAHAIAAALRVNNTLRSIKLDCCMLKAKSILEIFDALNSKNTLHEISLAGNVINAFDFVTIAQLLIDNRSLRSLTISWNNVCVPSYNAAIAALEQNYYLEQIDVGFVDETIGKIVTRNKINSEKVRFARTKPVSF